MTDSADMPEEVIEIPVLGPAALGLHRVGTALPPKPQPKPIQLLNARGMPARIRKRNRFFFADNIVNDHRGMRIRRQRKKPLKKPLKKPGRKVALKKLKKRKPIPIKYVKAKGIVKKVNSPARIPTIVIPADKVKGQKVGFKLRNLLKLPRAHKWVIFEWFYSYIDQPLLGGRNEFECYLDNKFPALKTRVLRRFHWAKIRKIMGKPRRFSQAFLEDERGELERRRQKIRLFQTKSLEEIFSFSLDLPYEIPLPLPVGTKVTARLRMPQDGIFCGTVDAVDSVTGTYRITFDRNGLGTHSIPDFEVMANNSYETISPACRKNAYRKHPRPNGTRRKRRGTLIKNEQLIIEPDKNVGNHSNKLIASIIRLKKLFAVKEAKIAILSAMNEEAKAQVYLVSTFSDEFERKYASIIVMLERINEEIEASLSKIIIFAKEVLTEPDQIALLNPTHLREKCRYLAENAVKQNNFVNLKNQKSLSLITNLGKMMQVASQLTGGSNSHEARVMHAVIEEVKRDLHPSNVEVFQKHVQLNLHHVQLSLEPGFNKDEEA